MSAHILSPFRALLRLFRAVCARRRHVLDLRAHYCPCGLPVPEAHWLCGPHCLNTATPPTDARTPGV